MYEEQKQILQNGRRMVFFGGAGVSTERRTWWSASPSGRCWEHV